MIFIFYYCFIIKSTLTKKFQRLLFFWAETPPCNAFLVPVSRKNLMGHPLLPALKKFFPRLIYRFSTKKLSRISEEAHCSNGVIY